MDGICELLGGVMSQEDLCKAVSAEVGRGRKMTRLPPPHLPFKLRPLTPKCFGTLGCGPKPRRGAWNTLPVL